ncbi:hypothetical protein K438DRAFT_1952695 [Mycena galopus ATCC 62051]|nr:hypothetical protein K438DRAFT_1952695 [Mycena galopus ATCC 62051]
MSVSDPLVWLITGTSCGLFLWRPSKKLRASKFNWPRWPQLFNSPEETFQQFNTNVFGALNVTRAFLPYMRPKPVAHFGCFSSSKLGGLYAASKYALRGISDALNMELEPFGIRSICINFGCFRTNVLVLGHQILCTTRISDYEMAKETEQAINDFSAQQPGDPVKGAEVVVDVLRDEGSTKGKPFPTSLAVGSDCHLVVQRAAEGALSCLEAWRAVSESTDIIEYETNALQMPATRVTCNCVTSKTSRSYADGTSNNLFAMVERAINYTRDPMTEGYKTNMITWEEFKQKIVRLYPGSDGRLWRSELEHFVAKTAQGEFIYEADVGRYHQEFNKIANRLQDRDLL